MALHKPEEGPSSADWVTRSSHMNRFLRREELVDSNDTIVGNDWRQSHAYEVAHERERDELVASLV